ncbi:hypothetical protein FQA39_LY01303 [Lamprigera yunnana]|nr:hypothetical protein FQA39_LY01303 [Lamprigera yunnana]
MSRVISNFDAEIEKQPKKLSSLHKNKILKMARISGFTTIILLTLCSTATFQNQPQKHFGDALEAIFSIGLRAQTLLDDPELSTSNNFLVSPLSVALLISQLMLGADREFAEELYDLLSLPKGNHHESATIQYYGPRKNSTFRVPYAKLHAQMGNLLRILQGADLSDSFNLNCNNALFIDSDLQLKDTFQHNLQIYKTDVEKVNFTGDSLGAQKFVNMWAAEQTKGVIKTMLPSPLPPSTAAILANALYFKADWETPFSYERNTIDFFYSSSDKKVRTEYMQENFDNLSYVDSATYGCKAVRIPYKNDQVAMYIMQPHLNNGEGYDIKKFIQKMTAKVFFELLSQMKNQRVTLQIPKLKLANSLSILEPLQKYRLYRKVYVENNTDTKDPIDTLEKRIKAFKALNTTERISIDLKQAKKDGVLRVSNILQQVHLNLDEKGTEAAAVTASIIEYMGGSALLLLNRPFSFVIRHEPTSAVLFWGAVVDPTTS